MKLCVYVCMLVSGCKVFGIGLTTKKHSRKLNSRYKIYQVKNFLYKRIRMTKIGQIEIWNVHASHHQQSQSTESAQHSTAHHFTSEPLTTNYSNFKIIALRQNVKLSNNFCWCLFSMKIYFRLWNHIAIPIFNLLFLSWFYAMSN